MKYIYRIISIISPGLIFGQSTLFWAYFRGGLFSGGLIFGMKFALKKGVGLLLRGIFLPKGLGLFHCNYTCVQSEFQGNLTKFSPNFSQIVIRLAKLSF